MLFVAHDSTQVLHTLGRWIIIALERSVLHESALWPEAIDRSVDGQS